MMSRTGLDTLTTMTKSRRRRYLAAEVKLLNHSFNEVRKCKDTSNKGTIQTISP